LKDPYSILGVSQSATDDQVKEAYRDLVRKYHPDNYSDDNPLKDLAKEKMQEVNSAYDEIMKLRASGAGQNNNGSAYGDQQRSAGTGPFAEVRRTINNRRFDDAQRMLLDMPEADRNAEWHYLISVILMHRGRSQDAMRELEIACNMDPSNVEYQKAKQMFNNASNAYGNTYYGSAVNNGRPYRSSSDEACNCCANLLCADCLCECLGGDLIRCL
jgi:tetratricopeptide (TPR) repeat protein